MDAIDRFQIRHLLGAGGFASVYLADDPALDAPVAIKLLADNLAADADIRERFINEARFMRRLVAPGLITVHDIGDYEGRPYIVMEYCERGTLHERLHHLGRPLSVDEGVGVSAALARCIGHMHAEGYVHRDLKPSNLLIRRSAAAQQPLGGLLGSDEELVVADFGLARVIDTAATRLSMAGGTPGYGAPEQFRADPTVDARADVYAASALVISAMTGIVPRTAFSAQDRPFDEETIAAVGPLAAPLRAGLSIDREHRPPDIGTWSETIAAAATPRDRPTDVLPAEPTVASFGGDTALLPPVSPKPNRAKLAVGIGAGVAALLLVIVGVVLATGSGDTARLIGPSDGAVGDTAVFAVLDATDVSWSINGRPENGRVIELTPRQAGSIELTVQASTGSARQTFTAVEGGPIRIGGPGLVDVGGFVELTATGASGDAVWTVGGTETTGRTIRIEPVEAGTVTVKLAADGQTVTRTITAVPEA